MAVHRRRAGWAVNAKNLRDFFPDLTQAQRSAIWRGVQVSEATGSEHGLDVANEVLGAYGIEAVRSLKMWDSYRGDTVAIYVNTGDIYNATILYDYERRKFYVTTLGDWVEMRGDALGIM